MLYNDYALDTFCKKYAKDLILCCFGEDAIHYAEDFKLTEYHLKKYYNNISSNLNLIQSKSILEIGSNTGIWAVLMYLNGATSITCVEPRKQLADGINRFSQMHNLPIVAITGLHNCIFDLNQTFDTTIMMGVDDLIPDIINFLNNLSNISKFLILKTKDSDALVNDKSMTITIENNLHHRQGFNINTTQDQLDNLGYQTTIKDFVNNPKLGRFIRFLYGKNFYETVFDYLDCNIVNFSNYHDTNDNFKIYSVKLNKL